MMTTRYTPARLAAAAGLLSGALALAGCGAAQSPTAPAASGGSDGHAGHAMPMNSSSATAAFNAADAMFAQMMIPHHEQAVEMSDIVLAKSGVDPRVEALAQQIKAAQAPEIATLKGWLAAWGQPGEMPSGSGHGMDGMLGAAELAQLKAADGAGASKLFLTQMIGHHEGAVRMAQTEKDSGRHQGAVKMAASVVDSQSKEIDAMRTLLAG